MQTVMVICTIANVVQAIVCHRLTGKFQTVFWVLAAFTGALSFI